MPAPRSQSGYRIAIVNPLTLVGNEIRTILRERSFPFTRLALLDASGQSAGTLTEVDSEPVMIASVSQEGLDGLDLVFFCGPPATNREWIERHQQDRFIAIDLSQPTTAENGRLTIAGLNLDESVDGSEVLVSPHPIAIPTALILDRIQSIVPVELCTGTVIQPASEYEKEGIEELAKQTISVLNVESVPKTVFDRQLAFNLYPAPERNEETIVSQVRSLIDAQPDVALLVTQGTIFHNHTFSLFVKTKKEVGEERIIEALKASPLFDFAEGDQQFGTVDAAGRDEILIADVRRDPSVRGGYWVWAVCDNLRRSSALNAVLIAEQVLFAGATN